MSLVLVVDDNSRLRQALAAVLEGGGYQVMQASDGKEAMALARQNPVSILITDLVMPGQEGMETISQFVKEFALIPIVAISGNPDYLPVAKSMGASAVLTKPISRTDLLRTVGSLIG